MATRIPLSRYRWALEHPTRTMQIASTDDGYTTEYLRLLVESFRKSEAKVPLGMEAGEARNFMGQRDGAPALGWVKTLWLDGNTLWATVEDIPKSLLPKFSTVTIRPEIREGRIVRVIVSGLNLPRPRSSEGFSVAMMSNGVTVKTFSEGDDHEDVISVDRLVKTRIAETGQSYADAARDVLADHPAIARAYLCRRGK